MTRGRFGALVGVLLLGGWLVSPASGQDLNTLLAGFITDLRNGTFSVGASKDVVLSTNGSGTFRMLGASTGNDENLTFDLDSTSNLVTVGSTTGVTIWDTALRTRRNPSTITVDGATTFAVTREHHILACTGAETIQTISGGTIGQWLILQHTDTDCTLDDTDTTAGGALDLTGVNTDDVGAAGKIIVLLSDGTGWFEVAESDN